MSKVFCVIGARKGTGLEIIKRLCEESKDVVSEIRALIRESTLLPEILSSPQDERVKVFVGDCLRPETLRSALHGANVVFFTASGSATGSTEVDEIGVRNTADVASQECAERLVLVSSQYVHPDNNWNWIRIMLNMMSPGIMNRKFEGEKHLRRSGIAYTVIRPGSLKDGPSHKAKLIVGQTNASLGSSMTRSDLADICFEASFSDNCKNVTFEIGSEKGQIGIDSNITLQKFFDLLSISWDDKWV